VLLTHLPAPDDLALEPDGTLLISDITAGTISTWTPQTGLRRLAGGFRAPEGMAVLADGAILVAEQGRNRVLKVDSSSGAVQPWRTFPNRTGQDGIDGIAIDPSTGEVIVPDSPNGVVWRVSADGSRATEIASRMVRPVDAAVEAGGQVLVADEGGPLWQVGASGMQQLARLSTPDDVALQPDGRAVVNTLGDNAVHLVTSAGQVSTLLSGLKGPQGIALDGAGNLYLTEFDAGRLDRLIQGFALDPVIAVRRGNRIAVCPGILRAPSDSGPDQLAVSGSLVPTRILQPSPDSSGYVEFQAQAGNLPTVAITARRGSLVVSEPLNLAG
jgi:sugar lactone lactonase YvrE